MIFKLTNNLFEENCYIVKGQDHKCVIIDPGFRTDTEKQGFLSQLGFMDLHPVAILLTHAHTDHIYGAAYTQQIFHIPIYLSAEDKPMMDNLKELFGRHKIPFADTNFDLSLFSKSDHSLILAGLNFEIIHTPGHSPGSVCYLLKEQGVIFTGDTLFAGTIGRTDLMGGDYDDEIRSIMEKLIILDPELTIYPGHGPYSSIAYERDHNPMLEPFNEPEESIDENLKPVMIHN